MRIFRHLSSENKNRTLTEVELDEYDEFHELITLSYEIQLETNEHKKIANDVALYICRAIAHGIHAYCSYSNVNRFVLCGKQLVTSTDSIISFSTANKNKYEVLEQIVKDFVNAIEEEKEEKEK